MKKHYLRSTRNLYYIDEKPNLRVYYSYSTPVALMIDGHLKVSENRWSITTARHLTWIDGGNKKSRLKKEDFQKLLDEHKPQPKHDFLKNCRHNVGFVWVDVQRGRQKESKQPKEKIF